MLQLDAAMLSRVEKPARYTGQEYNSVRKELHSGLVRVALSLPDVYEVGMSNLGLKILYQLLNEREDAAVERVYAPWVDMEKEMRQAGLPLYSLETRTPIRDFELLGFSLQYEMSYSNVLNMLDLAGISLLARERQEDEPLVIGGGPCAFNPEPAADFFDCFVLGEGEEVLGEVIAQYGAWKQAGKPGGRQEILRRLATCRGIYVPSFYEVHYDEASFDTTITPLQPEAPACVQKRVVADLDAMGTATRPIVSYVESVHDRIMLELFRGCTRGCRFCQAGIIYRPVRERQQETLQALAKEMLDNTGYNEMSLTSLSSADYSCLEPLVETLLEKHKAEGVSLSLPSLRIDSFSVDLAHKVQQVRKSGLTFAPEAGTQRLRDVINKGVTEENLRQAVSAAFSSGWSTVKLYFMIGLPTETDEDVLGIADLAYKVVDWYKAVKGRKGVKVTVSVSSFVPKPHTAFQWFPQNSREEIERKQQLLRERIRGGGVSLSWHDSRTSFLEGAFARGDRRLGAVLLAAWRGGARFDGWSEHFNYRTWMEAFEACNVDPHQYANRERRFEEKLPWDHLSCGVDKEFLKSEYAAALAETLTEDCRRGACGACGVCPVLGVSVQDWRSKNA